jgi:nitroimidazol reductase NimA-like FMN-containing flavoprotein (pyridoxamine 5'-phosphate oxidase superfamily)
MRRHAQEIHNPELIDQVIAHALVCRLGLCKDNVPYIVPVSFGYDGAHIYFHTAPEGLKLEFFAANPQVCFEFEDEVKTISKPDACQWSVSYASVIGYGTIAEIVDAQRKTYALNQVMQHYSGREWNLDPNQIPKTRVWAIAIDRMTGKQSKDKIAAWLSANNAN